MNLPDLKANSDFSEISLRTSSNPDTNKLGVSNDQDALSLFLRRAARRSQETLRRYTRELVRFTVFLRRERLRGFSECTVADIEAYVMFLHSPWPHWQQPGMDKSNPEKVFFPNAIKPGKSTDQIVTVLNSFFSYLQATGYLTGNPVHGFDKSGEKHARGHGESRFFYADEWQVIIRAIEEYPETTRSERMEKARLKYIFSIAYGLGLRQSELTGHSCEDIRRDNMGELTLYISGKGRRLRQLPINDNALQAIIQYRTLHGAEPFERDAFPLAPCLYPVKKNGVFKSMSPRQVRKWFSGFMQYCADRVFDNDPELARRLLSKSFHSLRHTTLSHLARNMDIEDLALFAGHEAITTTQQYYTPEKERLRDLTKAHGLTI
ncbi:tyrosine-type recombinase/integrase [Sansalvadorimonas sp. 2012CJ34-2]|uniref:Tyrosine-type recombinase/integrase n=1 Tax=Parendozoicomonas callyspongiae TaxID=2942213 RepID=A0ABT0PL69_9GAMM|nr:tyrosine-type recombinase/integrase [Sansalvadorimonas sp. 2012CJ34-2]MCL6272115.1 tyrosine-type recombinase/integrase [Sansalvadorimonas sp. 2012CJ34-2]